MIMTAEQSIDLARRTLPPLDGIAATEMAATAKLVVQRRPTASNGLNEPEMGWQVAFVHPRHGVICASVRGQQASWPYLGKLCEVNGVVYRTLGQARRTREALEAEGIAHHYPGTPEAARALRKHGVYRTPQIGERWAEHRVEEPMVYGVVVAIHDDDEVTLRYDDGQEERIDMRYIRPARAH